MQIFLSPPLKVVFTMPETKQEMLSIIILDKRGTTQMKRPHHLNNSMFKLVGKVTYPQIIHSIRLVRH